MPPFNRQQPQPKIVIPVPGVPPLGVVRSISREEQPPGSLISSQNVVPYGWADGFGRITQRPGVNLFCDTSTSTAIQGMCPIPHIVQPGGLILNPPPYDFTAWGLSTGTYTVSGPPGPTSYSILIEDSGPSITLTFSTIAKLYFDFPGYSGVAQFSVAIPYNSTGALSTNGHAIGGCLTFSMAGFLNSGAGSQFGYVSTLVAAVGTGEAVGIGGYDDSNSNPTFLNASTPSTQIADTWTLQATYIGNQNIAIYLVAKGGGFVTPTVVAKDTFDIVGLGGFAGWSRISTVPAATFASTGGTPSSGPILAVS